MIKSIELINFFSFKQQKVEFHCLDNIMVGINGSGKTNLLRAIKILQTSIISDGLKKLIIDEWGGFDAIFFKGKTDIQNQITIIYEFDYKVLSEFGYQFESNVFYQLTLNKISNANSYYLIEKLYQKILICNLVAFI